MKHLFYRVFRMGYFLPLLFLLHTCQKKDSSSKTVTSTSTLVSQKSPSQLSQLRLPKGFSIDIYAQVDGARSLALSSNGTLFVGSRRGNQVVAVKDTDGDFKADKKWVIASGLTMPNGVALYQGDLYVAEISRIHKFSKIDDHLDAPKSVVIYDRFPTDRHHGWKYIAFGPDGKLYVPVGAPCNICNPDNDVYASITRMSPEGKDFEIFARGVRNSVGFTWHPTTGEMWFTDNGRDMMGDDIPECELNHAPKKGLHFGYPYCHDGKVPDPIYGKEKPCSEFTQPSVSLGPHVAPLGLKFYTGDMFPKTYQNTLIIALHGSWNRSRKSGYYLALVKFQENKPVSLERFVDGWLNEETQEVSGRPVDVEIMPDGSVLVSDDYAGIVYRITYSK